MLSAQPLSCIKEGVKEVSFKLSTPESVLGMWYDLMFNEDDFYFLCVQPTESSHPVTITTNHNFSDNLVLTLFSELFMLFQPIFKETQCVQTFPSPTSFPQEKHARRDID